MDYIDQTFENTTVELDGNRYVNCTFRDVVLKYAGTGVDMEGCRMDRFAWQFDGALASGLFTLYQLFGTQGMLTIVRGFVEPGEPGQVIEL